MTMWPSVPGQARAPLAAVPSAPMPWATWMAPMPAAAAEEPLIDLYDDGEAAANGPAGLATRRTRLPRVALVAHQGVVYGCVQAAAATPAVAVFLDLSAPVGPSFLNPVGRVSSDGPLYALFCLLVSNGIAAPLLARALRRTLAEPAIMPLPRPSQRRDAALHGALGAMVTLLAAVLGCARLREEVAQRGAATGWEHGAFPNSYYWQALTVSAHLCLPLAALLGFHAASQLRASQLLFRQQQLDAALHLTASTPWAAPA